MDGVTLKHFASLTIAGNNRLIELIASKVIAVPEEVQRWIPIKHQSGCFKYGCFNHEICMYTASKTKDPELPMIAAINGSIEWLRYAHANGFVIDARTAEGSMIGGNVTCLRYILQIIGTCSSHGLSVASHYGHTECLDVGLAASEKSLSDMDKKYIMYSGARNNQIASLEVCLRFGIKPSLMVTRAAVFYVRCLKFIVENGGPVDESVMVYAINTAKLDSVRYLLSVSCPVSKVSTSTAILQRKFDIADVLIEHGCPVSRRNAIWRIYDNRRLREDT